MAVAFDDLQSRDWLHRGGVDGSYSWSTLWSLPAHEGSPGAVRSPGCMCGRAACQNRQTAGICVHDPVVCWCCDKFFWLDCVRPSADFMPGGILMQGGSDITHLLQHVLSWGKCPSCKADLGASNLPTTFSQMMGGALQHADRRSSSSSGMEELALRSLSLEAKHVFKQAQDCHAAGDPSSIANFTRAINICNKIRSFDARNFTLSIKDTWAKSQAMRARQEGHPALATQIQNNFLSGESGSVLGWKESPFSDAQPGAKAEFLVQCGMGRVDGMQQQTDINGQQVEVLGIAPNDRVKVRLLDGRILSLKPQRLTPLVAQAATLPLTMDWNNFASMFAESRDLRGAEAVALQPTFDGRPETAEHHSRTIPTWPEQGDREFAQLGGQQRGFVFWSPQDARGAPRQAAFNCYDYRWVFPSNDKAQSYFATLLQTRTEKSSTGANRLAPSLQARLGITGCDELLILTVCTNTMPRASMMGYNFLFRTQRVCGKIYFGRLSQKKLSQADVDASLHAMVSRFKTVVARVSAAQRQDTVLVGGVEEQLQALLWQRRLAHTRAMRLRARAAAAAGNGRSDAAAGGVGTEELDNSAAEEVFMRRFGHLGLGQGGEALELDSNLQECLKEALELKAQGNALFASGSFRLARAAYTRVVDLVHGSQPHFAGVEMNDCIEAKELVWLAAVCLSNRAECFLKDAEGGYNVHANALNARSDAQSVVALAERVVAGQGGGGGGRQKTDAIVEKVRLRMVRAEALLAPGLGQHVSASAPVSVPPQPPATAATAKVPKSGKGGTSTARSPLVPKLAEYGLVTSGAEIAAHATAASNDEECPICLAEWFALKNEPAIVLSCGHAVCTGCLRQWCATCIADSAAGGGREGGGGNRGGGGGRTKLELKPCVFCRVELPKMAIDALLRKLCVK